MWVTTTREARPRGSRSDSRRRRGRVDGLARARSSRGAQPEERERPARARGGRVSVGGGDGGCGPGRGELRSDHARKPRASSLQCNGALPGKRGEKIRVGVAGDAPPPEGLDFETVVPIARDAKMVSSASTSPSRVSRRWTRREVGPSPGCVAKRGGSSFPATGSAENSSGVARQHVKCATNRTPGTDAGRRSVTGRFREIPLESIFPTFRHTAPSPTRIRLLTPCSLIPPARHHDHGGDDAQVRGLAERGRPRFLG